MQVQNLSPAPLSKTSPATPVSAISPDVHKMLQNPELYAMVEGTLCGRLVKLLLARCNTTLEKHLYAYKAKGVVLSESLQIILGIAQATDNQEALDILYKYNPNLASICHIKLMAHRFSIVGKSQINGQFFELEGSDHRITFQALYNSLKQHLDLPEQEIILPIIEMILKVEKDPTIMPEILLDAYHQGKTIFLPLVFKLITASHIYGFLIKGNRLIKLNKGLHADLPTGLHIYKIADPSKINIEYIHRLLNTNVLRTYFEKGVDKELGLVHDHYIPTTLQKAGVCSWSIAKLALRGGFILEGIENGKIKYKKWSQADRFATVIDYLKQENVDPHLIASLWCRTKDQKIKEALEDRLTTTHIANENSTSLHLAAESNNFSVVEKLLMEGENINSEDAEGWTPLIAAACQGHVEMVEYLLERGAYVNKTGKTGLNAYWHLLSQQGECSKNPKMENHIKKVKQLLIEKGIDTDLSNGFRLMAQRHAKGF
ncbi:hypothetical protein DB41_HY00170 [Neochlamydia sp. TUME1]|jgi:hypothetical protein|uniref:ankyrin repeat domain-containing protein n=1 Tax=unclassified Neochlamydia TaxID=2643326 RepID=UPI000583CD7B|nr:MULTISPECIES: ankyrin repeat domain-containing protein [unclassified Neochlamydia]KIC74991.1 hypothetical protein DB41_HY00170 [Neochlamydia sp. TUME1]BBI16604.1 hypothetical protein NCS13_1_0409 [Neochlamydia sp. S13]